MAAKKKKKREKCNSKGVNKGIHFTHIQIRGIYQMECVQHYASHLPQTWKALALAFSNNVGTICSVRISLKAGCVVMVVLAHRNIGTDIANEKKF